MINVPPAGSESGTPIHQSSPEYQKSSPRHSSNSRILPPTPQTHINIRLGIHMFTTHWRLFCTLTLDTVANICSQIRIKRKNSYPVNNNCKSRIRPKKTGTASLNLELFQLLPVNIFFSPLGRTVKAKIFLFYSGQTQK